MKTQLKILSILTVFSLTFFSCEKDSDEIPRTETIENATDVDNTNSVVGADQAVPGEYIVVYKESKSFNFLFYFQHNKD